MTTNADPIIDRSETQKQKWIDEIRIELCAFGYSVVRTEWLHEKLDQDTANEKAPALTPHHRGASKDDAR